MDAWTLLSWMPPKPRWPQNGVTEFRSVKIALNLDVSLGVVVITVGFVCRISRGEPRFGGRRRGWGSPRFSFSFRRSRRFQLVVVAVGVLAMRAVVFALCFGWLVVVVTLKA
jgi:hypothetical protein